MNADQAVEQLRSVEDRLRHALADLPAMLRDVEEVRAAIERTQAEREGGQTTLEEAAKQ